MQPEMMRKNIPSEDQPHSFGIHTYEFRSCVVSKRTPARITLYHAKVCCGHSDFPMLLISCKCVQECFGSFWEVATDAAGDDAEKHTFGRSTTQLRNSYNEFRSCVVSKRTPVDREDAIDSLSQMMATKGSVYVVLGGKNLGKTLLTSEGNRD